jgi:glycosyltransferase involved in cell wall biosynthesis
MDTISVALCTFNGEKYITQQLDSIIQQSYRPSQIVICDDQSSDNTVKIIEEVAMHSIIPIEIHVNEYRLGVTKNFAKAISLCTHEYIAISDQDDIWKNNRLEVQINYFKEPKNKHINVVFTDLELVDENLNPLQKTMWEWLLFVDERRKKWLDGKQLQVMMETGNVVTGATLMIKKEFAGRILSFFEKSFKLKLYDEIIALLAIKEHSLGIIEIPLVLYRQHSNQVLGTANFTGDKKRTIDTAVAGLQTKKMPKEHLLHIIEHNSRKQKELALLGFDESQTKYYTLLINHIHQRIKLPSNYFSRCAVIVKEFISGRYLRYSKSLIMTPVKDLLSR